MTRILIVLIVLSISSGCAQKNAYDALRMSQQANCNKYDDMQREKCLADVNMSYQRYLDAN